MKYDNIVLKSDIAREENRCDLGNKPSGFIRINITLIFNQQYSQL